MAIPSRRYALGSFLSFLLFAGVKPSLTVRQICSLSYRTASRTPGMDFSIATLESRRSLYSLDVTSSNSRSRLAHGGSEGRRTLREIPGTCAVRTSGLSRWSRGKRWDRLDAHFVAPFGASDARADDTVRPDVCGHECGHLFEGFPHRQRGVVQRCVGRRGGIL